MDHGLTPLPNMASRSVLAQLLHALNQPLTGLQCSMEVALATPRTPEQYARGLREGLELTGRMRALVEAIREVVKDDEERQEEPEMTDLKAMLRSVVDDLLPVAEGKRVQITFDIPEVSLPVPRRTFAAILFRLLDSALSLSARGSTLGIGASRQAGEKGSDVWIRTRWRAGTPQPQFFRPELGLLVGQAGWERAGGRWKREHNGDSETVILEMPKFSP